MEPSGNRRSVVEVAGIKQQRQPAHKIAHPLAFCAHLLPVKSLVACSRSCKQWHQVVLPRISLLHLQRFAGILHSLFKEQPELERSIHLPEIRHSNSPNFLSVSHVLSEITSIFKRSEHLTMDFARAWVRLTIVPFGTEQKINQLVQKYRFSQSRVLSTLVHLYLVEGSREEAHDLVRECASLKHVSKHGLSGTSEEYITGKDESDSEQGEKAFVITCSAGWEITPPEVKENASDDENVDGEREEVVDEDELTEPIFNLEEGEKKPLPYIVRQKIFEEETIEDAVLMILKDYVSHHQLDEAFKYLMEFPENASQRWSSVGNELFEHLVKANKIEKALLMVKKDPLFGTDYTDLQEKLTCFFKYVDDPQMIDKIFQYFNTIGGNVHYCFDLRCHLARLLVGKKRGDLAYEVLKKVDSFGKEEKFAEILKQWVNLEVTAGHFVKVVEGIVGVNTFFLKNHLNPVLKRILSMASQHPLTSEQINVITDHLSRPDDKFLKPQFNWINFLIDRRMFSSAMNLLKTADQSWHWEEYQRAMLRLHASGFTE